MHWERDGYGYHQQPGLRIRTLLGRFPEAHEVPRQRCEQRKHDHSQDRSTNQQRRFWHLVDAFLQDVFLGHNNSERKPAALAGLNTYSQ